MTRKKLEVVISGERAGTLCQDKTGAYTFSYCQGYRGVPLSYSMPLSTRTYGNKTVLPYLWGLLPEDAQARKALATDANVSANNPFALLSVIGLDCPGAVQFYSSYPGTRLKEELILATDEKIADRLFYSRERHNAWTATDERWSLGGQQNKFALRFKSGNWFFCKGAAATTHILKSGIQGLKHQALNEYVCMRLASECGINAAQVQYHEFEGKSGSEPAIIIERYDRKIKNNNVMRLHQEDLCQALGCLPSKKYTMDGGPSSADVLKLLLKTGSAAQNNVANFLQMMFFNYLLAATDAHAKNYSLMLNADDTHQLAPMYDSASIAPYIDKERWELKPPKLAMSIGGENRIGHLTKNNLDKLVKQCNLGQVHISADGCAKLITLYADIIPEKLAKIFDELNKTKSAASAKELRSHMEKPIEQLCNKTKKVLED